MKLFIQFGVVSLSLVLIGCTHSTRLPFESVEDSVNPKIVSPVRIQAAPNEGQPAPSKLKGQRTLKLVKLMEGGICKNNDEGVLGVFLLYASPEDFERIKQTKGAEIFKDFEAEIQSFSLHAFEHAVNNTLIAISPFALDQDDAREQVTTELTQKFNTFIQADMLAFEQKNSLSIDIEPFSRSFQFYIDGCELNSD